MDIIPIKNDFSKTNIISICPITTKQSKIALNVLLDERTMAQGAVLCAHSKSIDIKRRSYTIVEELPKDKLEEIIDTIISIITPSE